MDIDKDSHPSENQKGPSSASGKTQEKRKPTCREVHANNEESRRKLRGRSVTGPTLVGKSSNKPAASGEVEDFRKKGKKRYGCQSISLL